VSRRFHRAASILVGAFLLISLAGLAGCGSRIALQPSAPPPTATAIPEDLTTTTGTQTTTIPVAVNGPYPGTYLRDEIPTPIVEGSYGYDGNGRFSGDSGDFFWRDGRFINPEGTIMEIPASLKQSLHEHGVDAEPIASATHYDAPKLDVTPGDGVSLTVTASQWTEDRVTATVVVRNGSGSSFRFANKDLQLYAHGIGMELTNPDLRPFEVAAGSAEFRTMSTSSLPSSIQRRANSSMRSASHRLRRPLLCCYLPWTTS
jgi:hypothetical protein